MDRLALNNNFANQESTYFRVMSRVSHIRLIWYVIGREYWKLVLMPSCLVGLLAACIMERLLREKAEDGGLYNRQW